MKWLGSWRVCAFCVVCAREIDEHCGAMGVRHCQKSFANNAHKYELLSPDICLHFTSHLSQTHFGWHHFFFSFVYFNFFPLCFARFAGCLSQFASCMQLGRPHLVHASATSPHRHVVHMLRNAFIWPGSLVACQFCCCCVVCARVPCSRWNRRRNFVHRARCPRPHPSLSLGLRWMMGARFCDVANDDE